MSSQNVSQRVLKIVSIPMLAVLLLVALLVLMLYMPVEANDGQKPPEGGGFPLIVGTSLNPTGSSHDMYEGDVVGNTFNPLGLNNSVGGATYDAANNRVLFTSSDGSTNIDQLYEWVVGTGSTTNLGTIMDVAGGPQRIDGLAMSGGVLYGSYGGGTAEDGLWTIDTTTLAATLVYPFSNSISGIDADPTTGTIYGTDDTNGNLVSIDPAGSITIIDAYPAGQADIDGLAVGDDGRAYLVTDEPGSFYVYNLGTNSYETPLTNPWTSADTFSGAAYISGGGPPMPAIVMTKTVGLDPNSCGTSSSLSVPSGGGGAVVGYCYTVMNTGNITLPFHDLVDSELGNIFTALNYDLGPGASVDTVAAGLVISAVITETTTNVATWTAYVDTATAASASSSATVTVQPPTSVSLSGISGSVGTSPLALMALVVVLLGIGAVIYRKRFV